MDYYLIWIIVIVIALIVEVITLGLTSIWFALAGLITLLLSFVIPWLPAQIVIFLALSGGMIYFLYPLLRDKMKKDTVKTNVEAVVGKTGIVTEAIDNLHSKGQVKVKGQYWTARSTDEDILIDVDTEIVVEEIQGVKAIVRKVEE